MAPRSCPSCGQGPLEVEIVGGRPGVLVGFCTACVLAVWPTIDVPVGRTSMDYPRSSDERGEAEVWSGAR